MTLGLMTAVNQELSALPGTLMTISNSSMLIQLNAPGGGLNWLGPLPNTYGSYSKFNSAPYIGEGISSDGVLIGSVKASAIILNRVYSTLMPEIYLYICAADTAIYSMTNCTNAITKLSNKPTQAPTSAPTVEPTNEPTSEPSSTPTVEPTSDPTSEPSSTPTVEPLFKPTVSPTAVPTPADTMFRPPVSYEAQMREKESNNKTATSHWVGYTIGAFAVISICAAFFVRNAYRSHDREDIEISAVERPLLTS